MWSWITNDATLKALGAIGGAISFLWGVGWTIYQHIQQKKADAAKAAGKGSVRQKNEEKERRPVRLLVMIGSVLAIWATVLFMAGTTWWLWKEYVVVTPSVISYVCRSDNGERCPEGANLVGCADATPAIDAVARNCKTFNAKVIMNTDGGRCGHTAWELTCTHK
jgi:hypothetical protein